MASKSILKNKLIWLCLLAFWPILLSARANYDALKTWDEATVSAASTAGNAEFLSEKEQEIIFLINLARMDGKRFEATFVKEYLDTALVPFGSDRGKSKYSQKYTSSLKSDLIKSAVLKPLSPSTDLFAEAKSHALDMGKTGMVGHNTSKGKKFDERMSPLLGKFLQLGENYHCGSDVPLVIVMELLIDDKIADVGHRKNILNKEFSHLGVSIQHHKKFRFITVMDFGKKK